MPFSIDQSLHPPTLSRVKRFPLSLPLSRSACVSRGVFMCIYIRVFIYICMHCVYGCKCMHVCIRGHIHTNTFSYLSTNWIYSMSLPSRVLSPSFPSSPVSSLPLLPYFFRHFSLRLDSQMHLPNITQSTFLREAVREGSLSNSSLIRGRYL